MTPREINGIVTTFQEPFRKDARKRLAVLNPAVRIGAKDLTDAKVWTKTTPSPKQLAEFLAKVACGLRTDKADLDNPVDTRVDAHVARGLMHNGRLAAAGDQMTIFADALRKGRASPDLPMRIGRLSTRSPPTSPQQTVRRRRRRIDPSPSARPASIESGRALDSLFGRIFYGKPVPTFPENALAPSRREADRDQHDAGRDGGDERHIRG